MKNTKDSVENRSLVDNLPEWKRQWVKEAASVETREYFFAVTKPGWKDVERRKSEVLEQAAQKAGFSDYKTVKGYIEWTKFGTPETEELERRIKAVNADSSAKIVELMKEQNAVTDRQEEKEYQVSAEKARLLERYTQYAITNIKQIMANGHLLMECDIEGVGKGLMSMVPKALVQELKNGLSKKEVAAQVFSGELLMMDKQRSLVLENGQIVKGFVNNRMGASNYDYQYQMAEVEGQRVVLNKTPDEYDHTLTFFTNTPIHFNGEKQLKVEYMRPVVELERARMSDIQITTSGTPYIRCKIDDVQQMREKMSAHDKALYDNAKTLWGIKAAAELTKVFAEKYYADTLGQELNRSMKR